MSMPLETNSATAPLPESAVHYHALCPLATTSVVLGALSILTVFSWYLAVIPLAEKDKTPLLLSVSSASGLPAMGEYIFRYFTNADLDAPVMVESRPSHLCTLTDNVSTRIKNDFSFPMACSVRFKYPAKGSRPAVDLIWYDGGMRPPVPAELFGDNKELDPEGMMFVGDKGKIIFSFF